MCNNNLSPEILPRTLLLQDSCCFCQQTILSAIADIFKEICQEMPFGIVLNHYPGCAKVSPMPLVIHVVFRVQSLQLRLLKHLSKLKNHKKRCLPRYKEETSQPDAPGCGRLYSSVLKIMSNTLV